jgi:hypothetical protein
MSKNMKAILLLSLASVLGLVLSVYAVPTAKGAHPHGNSVDVHVNRGGVSKHVTVDRSHGHSHIRVERHVAPPSVHYQPNVNVHVNQHYSGGHGNVNQHYSGGHAYGGHGHHHAAPHSGVAIERYPRAPVARGVGIAVGRVLGVPAYRRYPHSHGHNHHHH